MSALALLWFDGGPGATGALVYALALLFIPACIFWKPRLGLYLLVPLMPLQTLRYQLQEFPYGDKFMDALLLSTVLGMLLRERGSFPAATGIGPYLLKLAGFTYVSLWLGSFTLGLPLPLLPGNERFADWKNYVEMFLFFAVAAAAIRTRAQMKLLLLLMLLSALRANIGFYHTVSERDFSHFDYGLRYAGALGYAGENGLAAFEAQLLLLCLGLFSALRRLPLRAYVAVSAGFALYCLMFSFSRGGYMGLMAGLLYLGFAGRKKYFIVVAAILLSWQTLVPVAVQERILMTYSDGEVDSSAGERVDLWKDALTVIPKNPLLGTGFDTYKLLGRSEDYTDTHNYYMKVTVETGFLGLALFLLLLWKMLREALALRREAPPGDRFFQGLALGFGAMMTCVAVVNFFGDRWTFQQVTAYMWVTLALVCRARLLLREESPEPVNGRVLAALPIQEAGWPAPAGQTSLL